MSDPQKRELRPIDFGEGRHDDGPPSPPGPAPIYTLVCVCSNCERLGEVEIPRGVRVDHAECPNCGCATIERAVTEEDFVTPTGRRILQYMGLNHSEIQRAIEAILGSNEAQRRQQQPQPALMPSPTPAPAGPVGNPGPVGPAGPAGQGVYRTPRNVQSFGRHEWPHALQQNGAAGLINSWGPRPAGQ